MALYSIGYPLQIANTLFPFVENYHPGQLFVDDYSEKRSVFKIDTPKDKDSNNTGRD